MWRQHMVFLGCLSLLSNCIGLFPIGLSFSSWQALVEHGGRAMAWTPAHEQDIGENPVRSRGVYLLTKAWRKER